MVITILVENSTILKEYKRRHGLSAIISNGHKDHDSGLEAFLNRNDKANIYVNKYAFKRYHTSLFRYGKYYVGLNSELKFNQWIIQYKWKYGISF